MDKLRIFKTRYRVTGAPINLDDARELVIFRMVQEGLTNIIKHAGNCIIHVTIHYGQDAITVTLKDNGKGFDPATHMIGRREGAGLMNIQKRAEMINGSCEITSAPKKGTKLYIQIPFQNEQKR